MIFTIRINDTDKRNVGEGIPISRPQYHHTNLFTMIKVYWNPWIGSSELSGVGHYYNYCIHLCRLFLYAISYVPEHMPWLTSAAVFLKLSSLGTSESGRNGCKWVCIGDEYIRHWLIVSIPLWRMKKRKIWAFSVPCMGHQDVDQANKVAKSRHSPAEKLKLFMSPCCCN